MGLLDEIKSQIPAKSDTTPDDSPPPKDDQPTNEKKTMFDYGDEFRKMYGDKK